MPVKSSNKIKFYKSKRFWMWVGIGVVGFLICWPWLLDSDISTFAFSFYFLFYFLVNTLIPALVINIKISSFPVSLLISLLIYIYYIYIIFALKQSIKGQHRKIYLSTLIMLVLLTWIGFHVYTRSAFLNS